MSYTRLSHVTQTNESGHTDKRVTSHRQTSHVTQTNESRCNMNGLPDIFKGTNTRKYATKSDFHPQRTKERRKERIKDRKKERQTMPGKASNTQLSSTCICSHTHTHTQTDTHTPPLKLTQTRCTVRSFREETHPDKPKKNSNPSHIPHTQLLRTMGSILAHDSHIGET